MTLNLISGAEANLLRHLVRWAFSLILWLLMVNISCGAVESNNVFYGEILPPPQKNFKPWYEELYRYTQWPDPAKIPETKEIRYADYSYATLIMEMVRENVLEKDWQQHVIHVPKWIKRSRIANAFDAYVYRQRYSGGTLHICDTRPYLVIAFVFDSEQQPDQDSREALKNLTAMLLKVELPEPLVLEKDSVTGLFKGHVVYNVSKTGTSATGRYIKDRKKSSFGLSYTLGKKFVIYFFQKFHVPGCDLNSGLPLFCSASDKPTQIERAVEYLEGLRQVSPTNIPEIVRLLTSLPLLSYDNRSLSPYEYKLLSHAKYLGYDKIEAAMETISPDEGSIALVKEVLRALPKENDLRGRGHRMEEIALKKLKAIKSPSALEELRRIARTTKKPRIAEEAMEICLKAQPKDQVREYSLGELNKLADTPDSCPVETLMLIKGLGEKTDTRDVDLLRKILASTKETTIQNECFRRLQEIEGIEVSP